MALINEHIVKDEILKVVSQLMDKYEFETGVITIEDDEKNLICFRDALSIELIKILK